ncbi:uncharacterized protein LOC100651063 isoform X2 [Bombus terrestris]|uniref:Uncharacterized protein LOC100651063 isoform X2 n=1 Tax=Bombus terrestris TaxID=30195 RepID=A0A9C6SHX9_BOMTE|nr:uncharacterized protein LOC100651063 isoform X2 [Bombus terrestris]
MDYASVIDQAVKQFYAEGNNDVHSWLLKVQTSPEAWTFVWDLLHSSKSREAQFYAATTLHAKISKQWDEVPKSEYPVLQERLINFMKQPNMPKVVLSKLCQALAGYVTNVSIVTDNDNKDKNVVEELTRMLSYDSPPMLELLLRTLSLLPVEFERRHNVRRAKLHKCLINSWYKTTCLLQEVFSVTNLNSEYTNNDMHLLAMECALSWLKVGQLPLEATGQIYPHLLTAAAYYAPTSSQRWTEVESTLHAFEAVADSVGIEESHYIPALMDLVLSHIPYDHYPGEVLACACSTMGAYAEWIGEHPDPWLERVLRIVTLGLTRGSVTAPFATMALKDLARECEQQLTPFAPSILNTIEQTLPNITPGCAEGLRMMYVAGKLLNILPSVDEQLAHLDATLGLCIIKIRELLQQPWFMARGAVMNQLKMATMFFSTLEGSIGKAVLDGLLPIFSQIVAHPEWGQDNFTLEEMYICAQKSLMSLLHPEEDARPLLSILANSYKIWPHPAALNLLRQLILLFGRDPNNVIGPVFADISSITLSGVRACRSVNGNLSDWTELMEAYLGLLAQICKKNTRLLLQIPEQIPEMLQCGIDCLTLPESSTVKAAGHFLTHAIMQSPHPQTFIQPIGQQLVYVILQCVGGQVPRRYLEAHAEVLLTLNKICIEWTAQWLRVAFEKHGALFKFSQTQKENFIKNVLRERTNKRMYDLLQDFSLQNLPSATNWNVMTRKQ